MFSDNAIFAWFIRRNGVPLVQASPIFPLKSCYTVYIKYKNVCVSVLIVDISVKEIYTNGIKKGSMLQNVNYPQIFIRKGRLL